ncbi:MAG: MFS transporter [Chloroflexota bacterium]
MTYTPAQTERIGRRVVIVSALAQFIIFGIRLSFPAFFAEFILVEGWSSEAGASIFSVSMLLFALGSVPGGILLDRFGPKVVFTSGALLLALGLFLSGFASNITQLTISYGVIGGAGLSVIGLGPTAANIAAWIPPSSRGRAIGIAFAGTGLGSLVFVPLSTYLIGTMGWRNAYVVLGIIVICVVVPLFILGLVKHPSQGKNTNTKSTSEEAVNWRFYALSPIFWMLIILAFFTMGPVRSLTVHQIALLEIAGISRELASIAVGLAGFLTILAFTGWGFISDKFGRLWAYGSGAICLIGGVIVLWILSTMPNPILLFVYPVLLALGEGSRSSQVTALASDAYQGRGLGTINGWVGSMFGLGAAFGSWIVGLTYDLTDSYSYGLLIVASMTVLSMIAFWQVQRLHITRKSKP